jgi:hypothetical protein
MIQQFGPTMAPLIDVDIINNYQMNKVVELVSRSAFGSYKSTIPLHDDVRTRESPHDNLMGLFGDGLRSLHWVKYRMLSEGVQPVPPSIAIVPRRQE